MHTLEFITHIAAPQQAVFDLARSVEVHLESTAQTSEKAIGGKRNGMLALNEEVIWKGRHFGFWLVHHSRISEMRAPDFFVDEMVAGQFKSFRHEHFFERSVEGTTMRDVISYDTPLGLLGAVFDKLVLRAHLGRLISTRNEIIRKIAENADS